MHRVITITAAVLGKVGGDLLGYGYFGQKKLFTVFGETINLVLALKKKLNC